MKHLQSYNNFKKVNEELSPSEKRSLMFIPNALLGFLGKKLLGIYPMLNLKWSELKRATKGLKDSPFHTGDTQIMKHELEKVTIDKLPPNSLKWAMFLRDWNLYLAKDYKSTGGGEHGKIGRDVIYISKDEISKGDTYKGYRLSDSDIYPEDDFIMSKNSKGKLYPDKLKDPANFPMILIAARYDELEKVKEVQQLVDDICLEVEDELPVDVKPYFSREQDYLSLDIRVGESRNLLYSSDVNSLLTDVSERIKDYLKSEKLNFNYVINYRVEGPLFYNGSAGRFGTEIIPAAKEYSNRYDEDTDKALWNRHYKTLNVEKLSMNYAIDDKLFLSGSDIETLLSDLDNCTKSWSLNADLERYPERADALKERNKVTEIKLNQILVVFKKVK
jgi:hypothetical protein